MLAGLLLVVALMALAVTALLVMVVRLSSELVQERPFINAAHAAAELLDRFGEEPKAWHDVREMYEKMVALAETPLFRLTPFLQQRWSVGLGLWVEHHFTRFMNEMLKQKDLEAFDHCWKDAEGLLEGLDDLLERERGHYWSRLNEAVSDRYVREITALLDGRQNERYEKARRDKFNRAAELFGRVSNILPTYLRQTLMTRFHAIENGATPQ